MLNRARILLRPEGGDGGDPGEKPSGKPKTTAGAAAKAKGKPFEKKTAPKTDDNPGKSPEPKESEPAYKPGEPESEGILDMVGKFVRGE